MARAKDRTKYFRGIAEAQNKTKHIDRKNETLGVKSYTTKFALEAANIGKGIHETSGKLSNLMKLAKRKTLFDDPAAEIQDLTYIIKKDMTNLNNQIENLSGFISANNQQTKKNCDNIINILQTKLATTTNEFRKILEIRTENIKDQHRSRLELTGSPSSFANQFQPYPDPSFNNSSDEVRISMPSETTMAAQLHDYSRSRLEAVQSIETTIKEIETMFQRLAVIVSEQTEMMERIDNEATEAEMNITSAQAQLLKYWSDISSSRKLTFKIFIVLIIFIILFIVFFV